MASADRDSALSLASVVAAAERVLSVAQGAPVRLGEVTPLTEPRRKNLLLRCRIAAGPHGMLPTVIVKQAGMRHYHPDDPSSPAWLLFNDWAGAAFLGNLLADPPCGPRLMGGERDAGIVVLEDIPGDSLDDLLFGADRSRAEAALERLARRLGTMHAATMGRRAEYEGIRTTLGPIGRPADQDNVQRLRAAAQAGPTTLASIGIQVGATFVRELESVAAALERPGAFLGYTHGDPCPENCLYDGVALRLIDFEFGGFQHVLLDGADWHMAFPTSPRSHRLPDVLVDRLDAVYRQALVTGSPDAADETRYATALVDACAYWAFSWLARPPDQMVDRLRGRVVTRTQSFARLAARHSCRAELGRVAALAAREIGRRWPEAADGAPVYPALDRDRSFEPASFDRGRASTRSRACNDLDGGAR